MSISAIGLLGKTRKRTLRKGHFNNQANILVDYIYETRLPIKQQLLDLFGHSYDASYEMYILLKLLLIMMNILWSYLKLPRRYGVVLLFLQNVPIRLPLALMIKRFSAFCSASSLLLVIG